MSLVVEVAFTSQERWRMVGLLAFSVVLVTLSVGLIVWSPLEAIWGYSPWVPRIGGAMGVVGGLYLGAFALWTLLRRGPVLALDSEGFVSQSYPWRIRRVRWEEVERLSVLRERRLVVVSLKSGSAVKVAASGLERGWDEHRIIAEMRRLSGGRVGK